MSRFLSVSLELGIGHSKALAAFGATTLQDETSRLARHACTKTVFVATLAVVRLVCTLHQKFSSLSTPGEPESIC